MTGTDLMEWLADQPADVLARPIAVTDDSAERQYNLLGLYAAENGVLYVIDDRPKGQVEGEE